MDISQISMGKDAPKDINVIIEVPGNGEPVKYEMDKDSGAIFVDRILFTPMFYPCNYGFMPHTLSDDGDPVDVLVVGRHKLAPGSVIRCRPVGVLQMEDDGGQALSVSRMMLRGPVPRSQRSAYDRGRQEAAGIVEMLTYHGSRH